MIRTFICNLDEVSVLFSTQNTSGTSTYNWTSNVEIGAGLSGTGDMDFTAIITTAPVVATITVTPTFENGGIVCDGTQDLHNYSQSYGTS